MEDMHCAALGIADVDISTQDGAQDADECISRYISSHKSTPGAHEENPLYGGYHHTGTLCDHLCNGAEKQGRTHHQCPF